MNERSQEFYMVLAKKHVFQCSGNPIDEIGEPALRSSYNGYLSFLATAFTTVSFLQSSFLAVC